MLIKFKPTTPGLRGTVLVSKKELSKEKPYKSLTKKINSTGGRNNQGRITSRRMGGGVKRKYRVIDFKILSETQNKEYLTIKISAIVGSELSKSDCKIRPIIFCIFGNWIRFCPVADNYDIRIFN